ncbi:MAG: flagellar biosynthesis protein FliQ [Geminicoccaceae bacterium]|nr:flagellar biosynthesis protein FliQ [Geminicoccaceae bacterium]
MNEETFIELTRETLWVMVQVGAPVMLTALAVGLVISLLQALTQIQEMTLTFVPKVLALFGVLVLTVPFMLATLKDFTEHLFMRIATIGIG